MIASAEKSQLVIIDVQEKLSAAMPTEVLNKLVKRIELLVAASNGLDIPYICTEQYPKGLGKTLPKMQSFLSQAKYVEKKSFDCCAEPIFNRYLVRTRPQIFLMGMEAHICVLQTALTLMDKDKDVFVVEDAVVSRNILNKQNALNRLRQAGCVVTNTESIIFEWLKTSDHEIFKSLAPLIKEID
ncbi:isochorismatase family protein [Methylophilaceae bacterium]|nr:isochorismatase family protein [Methylophilaceae bacterium]